MRRLLPFDGKVPRVASTAWVAPSATLIGNVEVKKNASVWYGSVVRGDQALIEIGENSNIQDNTVIHVRSSELGHGEPNPTIIGNGCTVGHAALLHACTLGDFSFVGMQACLLDFSVVEEEAMVAAGALVLSGTVVKRGELWAGRPAKKLRDLTETELSFLRESADNYCDFADRHRRSLEKSHDN